MATIEVKTQAALDKALKSAKPTDIIVCVGKGEFVVSGSVSVTASGSVSVTAYDSVSVRAYDSVSVRAYDSVSVTASDSVSVRAYDSVSVRASGSVSVTASGSVSVTASDSVSVTASDSVSVRAYDFVSVRAYDSVSVTAYGSVSVRAAKFVSVHVDRRLSGDRPTISGGVLIEVKSFANPRDWCDYYGVEVRDDLAILFKAVDDDYSTDRARAKAIFYRPGETPAAPDWDGGKAECGGGLHFSPRPVLALEFNGSAKRFVACPVALDEIVLHQNAQFPNKIKAPRVAGPIFEVDRDGDPIAEIKAASHA